MLPIREYRLHAIYLIGQSEGHRGQRGVIGAEVVVLVLLLASIAPLSLETCTN